jgi:hypothetical protein
LAGDERLDGIFDEMAEMIARFDRGSYRPTICGRA